MFSKNGISGGRMGEDEEIVDLGFKFSMMLTFEVHSIQL